MVLLILNSSGRVLDSVGCDALIQVATTALLVGSEKDFIFSGNIPFQLFFGDRVAVRSLGCYLSSRCLRCSSQTVIVPKLILCILLLPLTLCAAHGYSAITRGRADLEVCSCLLFSAGDIWMVVGDVQEMRGLQLSQSR